MADVQSIDADFHKLVPADAKVAKLASGMKFVEGPVWVQDGETGYLLFSDIPASEIKRWHPADGLTTWRTPSFNANGATLDRQGRLLSCEHGSRVVSITENGVRRVLIEKHEGKRFNSPNDIVVTRAGIIYFTDPPYGLPPKERDLPKEIGGHYVFRFDPKTGKTQIVSSTCEMPNGLCFSPDEKKLYIADSGAAKNIRVFDVKEDGTLIGGEVFCAIDVGGPDGIRCDEHGNLWATSGDGVQVFSPTGKRIGRILVPEYAANLAFGGPDGKTLFVTARTSLYSIQTNVRGDSGRKLE